MSGYLENYRSGEERREKIVRWVLLGLLAAGILALVLYFQFRNRAEEQRIEAFLNLLRKNDYKAAYALWGCTDSTPCPNYKFERFMEDWGPKSQHADISTMKVGKLKSCRAGVIQILEFPNQPEVNLWVERSTLNVGFAPWPVCNPRMDAGQ